MKTDQMEGKLFILFVIITYAYCQISNEIDVRDNTSIQTRTANRGSFQKLSDLMNRTETIKNRKAKNNIKKILQINRKHRENDDMMNDKGTINQKPLELNDTMTLSHKMKTLRNESGVHKPFYKSTYTPLVPGVYCNFEKDISHMCLWNWNQSLSQQGFGFKVLTASDLFQMNRSENVYSGPYTDADNNTDGHFLYLPVDSTMENMVIKSPTFRGLLEYCRFEAQFHQSRMQNASIRLISESAEVQLIIQEVAGDNIEMWHRMKFNIGKVEQEVSIMIEITRPTYVTMDATYPHIAIDNIRLVDCLPEPPIAEDGECRPRQMKCTIHGMESCIKKNKICDLVRDCDDDSDEQQNCDKMPFGSYCNFEDGECGFVNIPKPTLKWIRHMGPTPTDLTGPNYDNTCGDPELTTTLIVPPLTPARLNHTLSSCKGYYFFVNMNVTGPNNEKADFASPAEIRTTTFNPPPKVHGDEYSKYHNSCMIRFYYQQNGRNYGSLSVHLVEVTPRGNISTSLWFSTKDKGEKWLRADIVLPNVTRRYFFIFKTRMGLRIYSDSAIDDFSLSPECFGLNIPEDVLGKYNYYEPQLQENTTAHRDFIGQKYYRFTPCSAEGFLGPNQTMCDIAYNNTAVDVDVIQTGQYAGVQVWEVPSEGLYSIIASGASGGLGASGTGVSFGASARGLFELHKGEKLYILVGQKGQDACKKSLSAHESDLCATKDISNTSLLYKSKTHEVKNTVVLDGAGGGGGGTFVFIKDKSGNDYPLIVGGGGGGISVGIFRDDGSQHGKALTNEPPASGNSYGNSHSADAGVGWASIWTGGVSLCRGRGGGFGGGGAGCSKGGGAGGYMGGNTNDGEHGGGGFSYIDSLRSIAEFSTVTNSHHMGHGEVVIVPAIYACGCAYRCIALNEYRNEVKCYCPLSWTMENGTRCVASNDDWTQWGLILVSVICVAVSLIVVVGCLCAYNKMQRKKEAKNRRKQLLEQEVQLHSLRNPPSGSNALMAFNPHYGSEGFLRQGIDFGGLPQVSRESLKLVKALGQGAFGEVYQGLYMHRSGDSTDMPVAVKTLPDMSTPQAEEDFLMEAAIMAKFNHPNIVHLIGICFDRHPRFIVLELLGGGDLKNFLRESRPKPERASALNMKDLLHCALDVCKGCRYLEAKRFIHRDIAARNCLLTSRGPGRVVKIADFGMARDIYRAEYYKKGGKAMLPIKWMPPEAYIDGMFTIKTDVWSFGVLLWEVFSLGVQPYTGYSNRQVMELVSGGGRLEKPYGCPQEIYRLMCECWNPNPEDRPAFSVMFDRLNVFLQDTTIISTALPAVTCFMAPQEETNPNGLQRSPPCDYLEPLSKADALPTSSSTDLLVPHSKSSKATHIPNEEDLPYQHLLKASQEYGNIQTSRRGSKDGEGSISPALESKNNKFQSSNSTDRLLSSVDVVSLDSTSEADPPTVWETSFTESPVSNTDNGPIVDKLINITPTSTEAPNVLFTAIIDKTNPKNIKITPISSPNPRLSNKPPELGPKPKRPLCLDAAQLEQNLSALKKNSGSVNLTTMKIVPPYINVVTPNKLCETKTIQIDPKNAVISDLQSPDEGSQKLKQSDSSSSLLNGPMTDVPYADSDNTSSNGSNGNKNCKTVKKQGSKQESEISC